MSLFLQKSEIFFIRKVLLLSYSNILGIFAIRYRKTGDHGFHRECNQNMSQGAVKNSRNKKKEMVQDSNTVYN